MNLTKNTGINLSKGSSISLQKDGHGLEEVCFGLNWGAIKNKGLISRLLNPTEPVDLDGTIAILDANKTLIDIVYYHQLVSKDGAIKHSGDDRAGDTGSDDEQDNEIIYFDLRKVTPKAHSIFVFLNSYKGQDFGSIPYSKVRIYEGKPGNIKSVFATFNLSAESGFAGKVSMVMGKLSKDEKGHWQFHTIGQAVDAPNIDETIKEIKRTFFIS